MSLDYGSKAAYLRPGYEPTRGVDIRLPGKGIQTPMAQGRSTKIISMIKWIRTSRLSTKNSLSGGRTWTVYSKSSSRVRVTAVTPRACFSVQGSLPEGEGRVLETSTLAQYYNYLYSSATNCIALQNAGEALDGRNQYHCPLTFATFEKVGTCPRLPYFA